jgi:hypothetical protein
MRSRTIPSGSSVFLSSGGRAPVIFSLRKLRCCATLNMGLASSMYSAALQDGSDTAPWALVPLRPVPKDILNDAASSYFKRVHEHTANEYGGPNKGTRGLDVPQGLVQTEKGKKVELRKCGVKHWKQPQCLRMIYEGEAAPSSHNAISSIPILQRLGFCAHLCCEDLDELLWRLFALVVEPIRRCSKRRNREEIGLSHIHI